MPPKAAPDLSSKTFSGEVLATILAASNTIIGGKHYEVMAKLDSSKTASSWEHTFRPIKARAKEITTMMEKGELGGTATPAKKSATEKAAKTPATSAKRGRKSKAEVNEESPAKKVKKEAVDESDADAEGDSNFRSERL